MTTATARRPPAALPGLPPRSRPTDPLGRMDGRVALVTGAAGGLGQAIVRRLAEERATVLATDHDSGAVRAVASAVKHAVPGSRVLASALDVTDAQGWARTLRDGRRALGAVDILVHAAGVAAPSRLDQVEPDEWSRTIKINQTSLLTGIRALLPTMWQAGGGSVVAIGSVYGQVGSGAAFAYHASKGALHAMVVAAAVELAPRRIRVNAVLPGLVDTPFNGHLDESYVSGFVEETPLARLGTAEDIAHAVLYLASDEADFVTGTLLPVDGGYLCR